METGPEPTIYIQKTFCLHIYIENMFSYQFNLTEVIKMQLRKQNTHFVILSLSHFFIPPIFISKHFVTLFLVLYLSNMTQKILSIWIQLHKYTGFLQDGSLCLFVTWFLHSKAIVAGVMMAYMKIDEIKGITSRTRTHNKITKPKEK